MDGWTLFDIFIGLMVLVIGCGFLLMFIGWYFSNTDQEDDEDEEDEEEDSGRSVLNFGTAAPLYNVMVRSNAGGMWVPVYSNLENENLAWTYAEKVKAEEGRPVKITDSKGNLVGTV